MQRERNADAADPQWRGKNLVKVADALKKRALEERDEADANAEKKQKTLAAIAKEWRFVLMEASVIQALVCGSKTSTELRLVLFKPPAA